MEKIPFGSAQGRQKNIVYPKVTFWDISKAFWQGIKPYKWSLFFVIFLVIIIQIASIIVPLFYKNFFDVITSASDKNSIAQKLIFIITSIFILNGAIWVAYRLANFLNNSLQTNVMARLKQQAYDYLMQHSYGFFTSNFTGSLVQRINRFSRAFERLLDNFVWNFLPLLMRVTSVVIVVSFLNAWIALVILIWAIIFLLFNILFSIWKIKYDLAVAEIDSKTTAVLADTITNQNTVSLFSRFGFESKNYKDITNKQAKVTKINWNLSELVATGQHFLGFSIEFIIFYFTIRYWQQGLVTVGFFVLLQAYLLNIMDQLWGFTRIVRDVYQAYADAKEMVEIMLLPHEIKDTPNAKELEIKNGQIEFKDLNFNFNQSRKVLENINLVIRSGERMALIGPSGAGKTTFVKLLLRLYLPTSGQIFIDGQDISKVTQDSLRKNIAMVPQDPILFHRTLAENISYGKLNTTKSEIEKVSQLAHCDKFVKNLPYGFETFVGERGIKLSGGERQRVAIARAILKNAPILILDEATSSLDSHSEMLIQDALNNLMQGRTTIVIAHRLSTIQKMDRIIVVDNGRVIEEGSHNDLLARENSLYRKLWTLQAGGFLAGEEDQEADEKEEEDEPIEEEINKSGKEDEVKFVNF